MHTDEEVKKCSVDSINAYIEQGKLFRLETTALPNDMYATVSKWNDDVVCFLRDLYGRSPVCYRRGSAFEAELRRPANAGERFALLIGHLEGLLGEIKNGNDCFFRRWNQDEAIRVACMQ